MPQDKPALVQFRPGRLVDEITARGDSLGTIAKRDLERYYALLVQCLDEVQISEHEALILAKVLRNRELDVRTVHPRADESVHCCAS